MNMFRRRTTAGDQRGQGLAEIALVIPVFVLALVGIFDVGTGVFTNSAVSQAAREGARLAATEAAWIGLTGGRCVATAGDITAANPGAQVCPADVATFKANIVTAVNRMAVTTGGVATVFISCNMGDAGDPVPTGAWTEASGGNGCVDGSGNPVSGSGETVSVRILYDYTPMTPIINDIIGTVPLSGSASMIIH